LAGKILDKVIPDPEARAKAKLQLQQLELDGELKQIQYQLSAILVEAQSNDPWTSRARPSFMYVIYIFILSALPMGVLFAVSPDTADAVTTGVGNWLTALPGEMWSVFAVGYLGYTGARTLEKRKLIDKGQL
jgi:hypothetical protein